MRLGQRLGSADRPEPLDVVVHDRLEVLAAELPVPEGR
jgi:hypothetical protein